jgi:hypothetical protein
MYESPEGVNRSHKIEETQTICVYLQMYFYVKVTYCLEFRPHNTPSLSISFIYIILQHIIC